MRVSLRAGLGAAFLVLFAGVAPGAGLMADADAARTISVSASLSSARALAPRWFADSSPWNTQIPANSTVAPHSATWTKALYDTIGQINVNRHAWTPTVVFASKSTPRRRIPLANGWTLDDVPLPGALAPSSDSDGHSVIIDVARGREYDFFRLTKGESGTWRASTGVVFRLSGSGWYNGRYCRRGVCGPWGARASSAALGGGLVRPLDVRAGIVPHALACSAPKELIGGLPMSPATTGDGSGGSGAMPMGSRLQLDPSLNVSSLGLEPGEEIIARALQVYGAYIVDSSSAFACYALQNSSTLGSNPYPSSWSNGISRNLVLSMRVVMPSSVPAYDNRAIFEQPHR